MSHLDDDRLALLALGEPVATADDSAHLASCPQCAADLSEMERAARIGRASFDSELEAPPERVWSRIVDELGLASADAPSVVVERPQDLSSEQTGGLIAAPAADPAVVPPRRRRSAGLWVLAAVVTLVAAAGLGTWAITRAPAVTEVAAASLDAFPDHQGASGTAVVEQERDGTRFVRVNLDAGAQPGSYREVWLITGDASALISLGVLDGDEGSFAIPDGIDLRDYVLVDISAEPIDGNPAHSGDSIVRGELSFA